VPTPLEELESMVAMQRRSEDWKRGPYYLGFANGLIVALAAIKGQEPAYIHTPTAWLEMNSTAQLIVRRARVHLAVAYATTTAAVIGVLVWVLAT